MDMSNAKDIELLNKVQDAIEKDFELSELYDINVDVVDGEVQLVGIVDTLSEKERLDRIVRNIPDVKTLSNDLTISTDGPITDRGVEFEVAEELQADPRVNMKHIGAKSSHGKVFLVGRSNDHEEILAAMEDASSARGVKQVISQIKPEKKNTPSEQIFHSQVRNDKE
ncbi:MAG: BON domain-containing protein [Peptococcaceae bacterium]|nr:BON domain-containing protein [Peptococcaceae bacterium]